MSEGEEELESELYHLPISHEVTLEKHFKAISALSMTKDGMMLVTGSVDYTTRIWDFAGMNR